MIAGLPLGRRLELVGRFMGSGLYEYQREYVAAHNDPACRSDLWNKARQTGLSTVAVADLAVEALASPDYVGLLVSTKQDKAARLLRRLKDCYKRPGDVFYRDLVVRENEHHLELSHGARIYALSGAPRDAREFTADRAVCDEFAHVEEQEALLTALTPALVRRGALTLISTPNGSGDMFHTYAANPEKYGVRVFEVPWWRCPELTPAYMEQERERLRAMGRSFAQEYECSFEAAAASLFTWELLARAEVAEPATKGGRCVIGWDPARDRDSSGVVVLRLEGDRREVVDAADLSRIPYNEQLRKVLDMGAKWQAARTYVDAYAQGDPIADFLGTSAAVVRCKLTKDHNRAAAAYIRTELERGKFTISPGVTLRRDLLRHLFAFDNGKGFFPYTTHTGHADLGTALFLAWQAVPRQPQRAARDVSRQFRGRGGLPRRRVPWYSSAA